MYYRKGSFSQSKDPRKFISWISPWPETNVEKALDQRHMVDSTFIMFVCFTCLLSSLHTDMSIEISDDDDGDDHKHEKDTEEEKGDVLKLEIGVTALEITAGHRSLTGWNYGLTGLKHLEMITISYLHLKLIYNHLNSVIQYFYRYENKLSVNPKQRVNF